MNNERKWPGWIILFIVVAVGLLWLAGKTHGDELQSGVVDLLAAPITIFCPEEFTEGENLRLDFETPESKDIVVIKARIHYKLCPLGERLRGECDITLSEKPVTGMITSFGWQVPWLDTLEAEVVVIGFNSRYEKTTMVKKMVKFIPKAVADQDYTAKPKVVLVDKKHQREYFIHNGKPEIMGLISSGRYHPEDGRGEETPAGWFKVMAKDADARSEKYHCPMPYWIQFTVSKKTGKGIGLHASLKKLEKNLGKQDSHGCVRQLRSVAARIFQLLPEDGWVRVVL